METAILDAGPLVAYFDANEEHHEWCVPQFDALRPPLLSCATAIAEAAYVLKRAMATVPVCLSFFDRRSFNFRSNWKGKSKPSLNCGGAMLICQWIWRMRASCA